MAVNNGHPDDQDSQAQRRNNADHASSQYGFQRAGMSSPEDDRSSPIMFNPYYTGRPRTPTSSAKSNGIDRQEIIRRIKGGESRPTSPELDRVALQDVVRKRKPYTAKSPSPHPDSRPKSPTIPQDNTSIGAQIERPRSALHRGDFWESGQASTAFDGGAAFKRNEPPAPPSYSTSPVAPWHPEFPPALRSAREPQSFPIAERGVPIARPTHARTASHATLAASFAYKPPTSPLAQSSRPDTPELQDRRASPSPDKSRRHTFSPQSFRQYPSALHSPGSHQTVEGSTAMPRLRSERTFPYQAHQPRRSLTSNPFSSLPQTPIPTSRRPSISESPLHHAPMVGSYEESILRGRMSTTPSKPLNFVAQIGVLGKGHCKPNLRCPPHVSIPFPAVFYSYGHGGRTAPMNDQPSPYVGMVDLEHSITSTAATSSKRRQRVHGAPSSNEGSRANSRTRAHNDGSTSERRRKQKDKRRSTSPKAPPGGSYRIPQQGQLQIVIKNPNKTAVKLFLVPYDLTDMEPGQKTFIRQRSYSAGPIIDMPLSSRKNLGTDRPEAAIIASNDLDERPTLRYLIHLHICSPSKGRYFLYKSIRVVFANRVPDGKEKLRNEIQLPDPKYSTYKPGRDSISHIGGGAPDPSKRHSMQNSPTPTTAEPAWPSYARKMAQSLPASESNMPYDMPMQAHPRHFTTLPTLESRPASRQMSDSMDIDSDRSQDTQSVRSPFSSPTSDHRPPLSIFTRFDEPFSFERDLSRERAGNGGGRNESLLSKRLMDLAFQNLGNGDEGT